jgi:hypothetical protein
MSQIGKVVFHLGKGKQRIQMVSVVSEKVQESGSPG